MNPTSSYQMLFLTTPHGRNSVEETFGKIKQALRPDGILTGQFFGVHDTWNTPGTMMTFCTREQAQKFLHDLSIITFWEEDEEGETALEQLKHWHVFHFIARK